MTAMKDPAKGKKRKRNEGSRTNLSVEEYEADVLDTEKKILESHKNFNDIPMLIGRLNDDELAETWKYTFVAISLCRVLCKLMAAGNFSTSRNSSEHDRIIAQWLSDRVDEFTKKMQEWLVSNVPAKQSSALALMLRVFREQSKYLDRSVHESWSSGIFVNLMNALITHPSMDSARGDYVENYVNKYDDVRYHTFSWLAYVDSLLNRIELISDFPQ